MATLGGRARGNSGAPVGCGLTAEQQNGVSRRRYFELDSAIFRDFPIWERYTLEFKAQAFAVTNTPIYGNPNAQQGSGSFGQITSLAASANGVSNGGGYRIRNWR